MRLLKWFPVLCVAVACGELPDPATPIGAPEPPADVQDNTAIDPNAPPPAAPSLSAVPMRYGYDSLPLRGQAVPLQTVFVEGGKAPAATDSDTSGAFCVDVPLVTDKSQELRVFVQDTRGVTSDPATLTIEQDPSLAEVVTPQQPLVQLAKGKPVFSDSSAKEGSMLWLTDENPTTSVLFPEVTLWITFGDAFDFERLVLMFPDSPGVGDDTFATEYEILASNQATPTMPPAADAAGWVLVYEVYPGSGLAAGDGATDIFALPTPMRARHLAFHLIENNKTDWFSSENIRVSEIMAYGRSTEVLAAEPQTPTCANGLAP